MTDVLIRWKNLEASTCTGRTPCVDEGVDQCNASTSQEISEIARKPLEVRREAQIDSFPLE